MKISRLQRLLLIACVFTASFFIARFLLKPKSPEALKQISGIGHVTSVITPAERIEFRKRYLQIISGAATDPSAEKIAEEFKGPPSERMLLEAAALHREVQYDSMFVKLLAMWQPANPDYEYYDELVFGAAAAGKLPQVELLLRKKADTSVAQYFYCSGLVAQAESQYLKAADYFGECITRDSKVGQAALKKANNLLNAGKSDAAAAVVEKYTILFADDFALQAEALLLHGASAFYLGDNKKAQDYYEQALALASKADLRTFSSRAMVDIGIVLDQEGKFSEARKLYQEAARKASQVNDAFSSGLALGELGVSYSYTNQLADALEQYKGAIKQYAAINNHLRLALVYANIGNIYVSMGDLPEAKEAYEKGLNFSENAPRAQCLNAIGLGDIYTNTGNFSGALKLYEQAREQLESSKLLDLKTSVDLSVGALSFNIGRYQSTVQVCTALLNANAGMTPVEAARLYRQMGLAYFEMDSLQQAMPCFEEAGNIAAQFKLTGDRCRILLDEANQYIEQEKWNEAGAKLALARASVQQLQASEQLYYHTVALRYAIVKKDFGMAERVTSEGEKLLHRATHPDFKAEFLFEAANYYSSRGNKTKAAENYIASISLLENTSATLLPYQQLHIGRRTAVYEVYQKVINWFISQGQEEEAFTILDHARAKNSYYAISEKMFANRNFSREDFEKYQELGWMVESGLYSNAQVDSLLQVRHVYELKGKLAGFFSDEGYLQSPRSYISSLQAKLNDKTYILSLFSGAHESRFFIVSQRGFVSIPVPEGKEELKTLLSQVSAHFSEKQSAHLPANPDLFAFNAEKANELYKEVFQPAFSVIPENSNIIFIPSEEFYSFPVEMLVKNFDKTQSPYKYTAVDFLVEHYTLSSAPSAGIYTRLMDERHLDFANALVIGNPVFGNSRGVYAERRGLFEDNPGVPRSITLFPLKYSEEEIEAVRDNFKSVSFYNGSDATETNFKAQAEKSSIIHLSTHSWLIGNQPAIFFTPENDSLNDGVLEAGEVAQMNLHASLVSLSSCNSGEGLHEASEGIVGMTKAFLDAGAASVVVSLWEVNDRYTAAFMKLFYSALHDGKSKSEALREAKQEFIRTISANPYYWSGFVLVGNTGALPEGITGARPPYIPYALGFIIFLAMLVYLRNMYRVREGR